MVRKAKDGAVAQDGLLVLDRLLNVVHQVLEKRGGPLHKRVRSLLSRVVPVLGAQGGLLALWNVEGGLASCPTRGLCYEAGHRLRRLVQDPPPNLDEFLNKLHWRTLIPGEGLDSGWPELDHLMGLLARDIHLALWPLNWRWGRGMVCLLFRQQPAWPLRTAPVAAGYLGLALNNLLLQDQAEANSDDYQRIFQNSQDMVYLSSREGRWVRVNPAGVRLLGYDSEEQMLAQAQSATAAYMDAGDRQAFMAAIEKDGFVKDYEVTFQRRDGSPVEVSITSQVRRVQGQVVGYEGIIKDITHRKWGEAQAERQRFLVESILEAMPVAVFVLDQNHRVIHWNRACSQLTGMDKAQMLGGREAWKVLHRGSGVSLADLVVDGDWQRIRRFYGDQTPKRSPLFRDAWEAEAHLANLGGRTRELFFIAAALRDLEGQVVGAVEAILDMTHIKTLESQLAESESLYRGLVEAYREGIALHDGTRFVFANQPFLDMFGLKDLEEAPGDLLELLAPVSRRPYLEWRRSVDGQETVSGIFDGQGCQGMHTFDLEINTSPTSYQGAQAMFYTVRDVTQRKQMEEQLIRSERLAATGKLAFEIAHEVNNPLGGIMTFAHLLAEDLGEGHPLAATTDKIIKLANRCKLIVRGLLDFARLDTPEREIMDLNLVLTDTITLIEGNPIMKEITVGQDLDLELPLFYGHRGKLEQVFLNMMVNAAEAIDGHGSLEVATQWDKERGEIRIGFSDNGPGMSEETARSVFEPFYTTKPQGKGTGLGLAISFGIVKQHEGRIELESQAGQGSRFTVVLPAGSAFMGESCPLR